MRRPCRRSRASASLAFRHAARKACSPSLSSGSTTSRSTARSASPRNSSPSGRSARSHRRAWRCNVLRWASNQAALSWRTGPISRSWANSYQVAPRRSSARNRCASTSRRTASFASPSVASGARSTWPRSPLSVMSCPSIQSRMRRSPTPLACAVAATCSA